MLLFLNQLGIGEIALILGLALLLFGPKKLPEIGRNLGKGLREFKKGTSGLMESINMDPEPEPTTKQATTKPTPAVEAPTPAKEQVPPTVIDLEKDGERAT